MWRAHDAAAGEIIRITRSKFAKKTVEIRDIHRLLPTACVRSIKKYVQAFLCFCVCSFIYVLTQLVQSLLYRTAPAYFTCRALSIVENVATRVENINRRNDTGVEIMFSRNYVALNSRVTIGRGLSCN